MGTPWSAVGVHMSIVHQYGTVEQSASPIGSCHAKSRYPALPIFVYSALLNSRRWSSRLHQRLKMEKKNKTPSIRRRQSLNRLRLFGAFSVYSADFSVYSAGNSVYSARDFTKSSSIRRRIRLFGGLRLFGKTIKIPSVFEHFCFAGDQDTE